MSAPMRRKGVHWDLFAAGLGASLTDSLLNPLEVVKVKLQAPGQTLYMSPRHCAKSVLESDGLLGLWFPGLVATWVRDFTYTAARLGLYPTIRAFYAGQDPAGAAQLWRQLLAGASTGAIASVLFSPVDLVRIRLVIDSGRLGPSGVLTTGLRTGAAPRYSNTFTAFASVARDEGIGSLWRGMSANVLRATTMSAAQLASYDTMKRRAVHHGIQEGPLLHLAASLGSGFFAQTACQPFDTVRTRVMGGATSHRSVLACIRHVWAADGIRGLYRGYTPGLARQCPVMLVQMPLVEQIRGFLGMGYI